MAVSAHGLPSPTARLFQAPWIAKDSIKSLERLIQSRLNSKSIVSKWSLPSSCPLCFLVCTLQHHIRDYNVATSNDKTPLSDKILFSVRLMI